MEAKDYLDLAKEKLGFTSDYALSVEMGLTKTAISNYRSGNRKLDEYACFKLAEILNIEPAEIIVNVKAQSEKDEKKRDFWKALKKQTKGGLGAVVISSALLFPVHNKAMNDAQFSEEESAEEIYIM